MYEVQAEKEDVSIETLRSLKTLTFLKQALRGPLFFNVKIKGVSRIARINVVLLPC